MDVNFIPTIGGGVLLFAVWTSAILGRAYVLRLRDESERTDATEPDQPPAG